MLRQAMLLGVAALAGCQSTPTKPAPPAQVKAQPEPVAPISNTDACAGRLHDICGPLLLYYATRHRLPARLEDLRDVPGFEASMQFACPISRKPYVYNPVGLLRPEDPSRVILFDPAPSHSGMRWAVAIIEPRDNGPLVTKVIALPESHFNLQLPAK